LEKNEEVICPGKSPKSIGFEVKTGNIFIDGEIIYTFDFMAEI